MGKILELNKKIDDMNKMIIDVNDKIIALNRKPKKSKTVNNTAKAGLHKGYTRATFILSEDLLNQLKDIAYTERATIKEIANTALKQYADNFKSKDILKRKKINLI